jgi:UDP-3-O-[3-hydroxymyristoyl] glucosamine N-acyltransferase
MPVSHTIGEIAALIEGAKVVGNAGQSVVRFVHPTVANGAEDLTLLTAAPYLEQAARYPDRVKCIVTGANLMETHAAVIEGFEAAIVIDRPRAALSVITALFPRQPQPAEAVHPSAFVDPTAELGEGTIVGANAVILAGAKLGKDCVVHPGVVIMDGVQIGDRCVFQPNCVVGGDGFSFVTPHENAAEAAKAGRPIPKNGASGKLQRIDSLGSVIIGDDVEVGACSCIDRAMLGDTKIASGTKIDNLVQVAHGVEIDEDVLLCSHVGIAGSTKIGKRVIFAGQSGCADHVTIGDDAVMMGRTGVTRSLAGGQVYYGMPAAPVVKMQKAYVLTLKLDEMRRKMLSIEKDLKELKAKQ